MCKARSRVRLGLSKGIEAKSSRKDLLALTLSSSQRGDDRSPARLIARWIPRDARPRRESRRTRFTGPTLSHAAYLFVMTLAHLAFLRIGAQAVEIQMPAVDAKAPIRILGPRASTWQQGAYEVWVFPDGVEIAQGSFFSRAKSAALWIERHNPLEWNPDRILLYLEGDVSIANQHPGAAHRISERAEQSYSTSAWFGRLQSLDGVQVDAPQRIPERLDQTGVYSRGLDARGIEPDRPVEQVQYAEPVPDTQNAIAQRRVRMSPRGSTRFQSYSHPSPDGSEQVTTITSGVVIQVDGAIEDGPVELAADRVVIWSPRFDGLGFGQSVSFQPASAPLEFYIEGDIVFRQADRVIYAQSMYYNVRDRYGVVLQAELLTPVSELPGVTDYQGLLRLKADVLKQVNVEQFSAHGASVTSSRLGVPTYWFQSEEISFEDRIQPAADPFTGLARLDPVTGEPIVDHDMTLTSRNNFIYLLGRPVFYWPVLSTKLTKPSFYVDSIRIKNDNIFGTQLITRLDVYQILGIENPPEHSDWTFGVDYLSDRGFGAGSNYRYRGDQFLHFEGPVNGELDAWGIDDKGFDNLGANRRQLVPEKETRGRVRWRHRQYLDNGFQFTGELGLISDRNFLEQYYEREWDELKDQLTGFELKQLMGNKSWSLSSYVRLNDFFTQTEWFPRLAHYQLGQSLLFDRLTWYEHSHVGYAKMHEATAPLDPDDLAQWNPLPWDANREGLLAATRQELDLPLQLGPVKVTPYVLGEIAHWGEDLDGVEVTRTYGQAGLRTSLPMWKVDPSVHSELFNVNGLAHKVSFNSELFVADANRDLGRFPLYDPLDDDANEHFRRRIPDTTFGGSPFVFDTVPWRFDPRSFALRSGIQNWVTSPTTEIADDLAVAQLGVHQRWQTKRGMPGQERIVDWISLDLEGTYFPEAERDNFGEDAGMLSYDLRWHLGDRVTLLSDGYADVFSNGLRTLSIGGYLTRPGRSSVYAGFRSMEGPISSRVLVTSFNYRWSPKWISRSTSLVDFGEVGNIGQSYEITRIGESFLLSVGVNIDRSRDNVSFGFALEPRFLVNSRRARIGGMGIPPVGTYGPE